MTNQFPKTFCRVLVRVVPVRRGCPRAMMFFTATLSALVTLASISSFLPCEAAEIIPESTFRSPFNTFDNEGRRQISPYFTYGGNVDVNENFVRITADRAVRLSLCVCLEVPLLGCGSPITACKLVVMAAHSGKHAFPC